MSTESSTGSASSGGTQKDVYDRVYRDVVPIPFPDRKIEGSAELRNKTIISVGGGTGTDVAHLAKENRVHVLDYSASTAGVVTALGMQHHQVDLSAANFRLPFGDRSADVVVLKDILEHLPDPAALMLETRRVLTGDGYVVISIPNHFNIWGRIRILFGGNLIWKGILHDHTDHYSEWNYMHIRFFTWNGLNRFIRDCGFEVTRTFLDFGPFGHYFQIPMYAEHLRMKEERGLLTTKGRWFLKIAYPMYRAFNFILPERLRNAICWLSPGATTSCFYLHVEVAGQ